MSDYEVKASFDDDVEQPMTRYKCLHCLNSIVATKVPSFCEHCGFRLDQKCSKCSQTVKFSQKFCSHCGAKNLAYVNFPTPSKMCCAKMFVTLIVLLALIGAVAVIGGIAQWFNMEQQKTDPWRHHY
ncbi:unnamed protein product [Bursaphelenchus xylophilus]|uniref:(pine wood nematode) hypothetical protein n=1 Tax=Bursaphelenchus xylophilus TaxID=6326 RepID=A0A1I7SI59_BURXY|nr:unnamed protein product [Bursaphelenchus xylophilus]CAG9079059.1 unnamed protein product [Bursaphelenchus xylophilus]